MAGASLARSQGGSGPVMLLPERRHHGLYQKDWGGPDRGSFLGDPTVHLNFSPLWAERFGKKSWTVISLAAGVIKDLDILIPCKFNEIS